MNKGTLTIRRIFTLMLMIGIFIVGGLSINLLLTSCGRTERQSPDDIAYYTCGMHPSVRIKPEDYHEDVLCPICNMKLVPVKKEIPEQTGEQEESKGKTGEILKEETKIKISKAQADLAGIKTERIQKLHLFKEIRTVGKIAYDPELAIAQDEFVSALKSLDKIEHGNIPEIKERARNLLISSERKLRLLGLSIVQIDTLRTTREIQKNLILPEKKMWIYGDVYEYELSWVKIGGKVKVTTTSIPGKEYTGTISSINPVVNSKTRSITFRALIDNTELQLKPEMYINVKIMSMYRGSDGSHKVLAIPKDAVLDTGTRRVVWVKKEDGSYVRRSVEIGPEATAQVNGQERKFYPVLKGLHENEAVVTKANFLIDSQSQLSGSSAVAYGGALGSDDKKAIPAPVHH